MLISEAFGFALEVSAGAPPAGFARHGGAQTNRVALDRARR